MSSQGSKQFWQTVKFLKKTSSQIPTLKKGSDEISSNADKAGHDGISGKMLKNTAISIAPSVTKLFNQSISTGKIPHKWKLSSIVPIPKSSVKTNNSYNYRPISLLPVISKLLERHIHNVVLPHLM